MASADRPTNLSALAFGDSVGAPLPDQLLDVASFGGDLTIGLSSGSFAPLLMGGGGILRFQPEAGEELRRIQLRYGVGFRGVLANALEAEVMVERSRYYLDPPELAAPATALPHEPGAGALRRNLADRLGLGLQPGEGDFAGASDLDRAVEGRVERPSSGLGLALEPFGGRQTFDSSMGIDDQDIAGLRAGLDFGPFVGLHGFHWRGVNDDYDAWEGITGYGGEAQFNLGGGAAFSPYLLAGGGKMEFAPDFRTRTQRVPADRTALILGGGVDLGLGSTVRLSAAARSYLTSGPDDGGVTVDLEDIRSPGDLVHNWHMSVGLNIGVGGRRAAIRSRRRSRPSRPFRVLAERHLYRQGRARRNRRYLRRHLHRRPP